MFCSLIALPIHNLAPNTPLQTPRLFLTVIYSTYNLRVKAGAVRRGRPAGERLELVSVPPQLPLPPAVAVQSKPAQVWARGTGGCRIWFQQRSLWGMEPQTPRVPRAVCDDRARCHISQPRLVFYLIFLPLFLEQINKMLQSRGQSLRKHQKPYNKQLMSGSSLAHLIFPN